MKLPSRSKQNVAVRQYAVGSRIVSLRGKRRLLGMRGRGNPPLHRAPHAVKLFLAQFEQL